ncbi:MAG TPA: chromosomal replication initiator protein DnaA [Clostridiales bacterium]|nr:chromosomal replication initiator protein DnaA [Clostridiales bacterium]
MDPLNEIWQAALELMAKDYSDTFMDLWFRCLSLTALDGKSAELSCPSDFKTSSLNKGYLDTLEKYLEMVLGYKPKATVVSTEPPKKGGHDWRLPGVDGGAAASDAAEDTETDSAADGEDEDKPSAAADDSRSGSLSYGSSSADSASLDSGLPFDAPDMAADAREQPDSADPQLPPSLHRAEYTFDNFIVGSSNKFAHAACTAVADKPGKSWNPLYIHGPSGLGKTHLLYAIINSVVARYPKSIIVYVNGEQFTNEIIEAIARGATSQFRAKYRTADMLLIDDIQFIAGKDATQEEFFHTFNALYEEQKQIIITSDRPPRDIRTLEERLRTRFEWGLIADIKPPDYELRIAIMQNKANAMGMNIPLDVFRFLSENLRSNVRQLEGAIKKIYAHSYLTKEPVTVEMALHCISDMVSGQQRAAVTPERIIAGVANKYGVSADDLKGKKRSQDIAEPRHIAIYIMRRMTEMSLPQIGREFSRDHTTIMSSIAKIDERIKNNSVFEIEINELMKEFNRMP